MESIVKVKDVLGNLHSIEIDTDFPVEFILPTEKTEIKTVVSGPTYATSIKWIGARPARARRK